MNLSAIEVEKTYDLIQNAYFPVVANSSDAPQCATDPEMQLLQKDVKTKRFNLWYPDICKDSIRQRTCSPLGIRFIS